MPFCPKCGKEVSPEASYCTSCGASLRVEKVRYDGLYVSGPQDVIPSDYGSCYHYLRFYEDGTVLAASVVLTEGPNQVIRWFDKSNPNISKGQYSIQGNTIRFSTTSPQGDVVDYAGQIINDRLKLHWRSRIIRRGFDSRGFEDYTFVKVS